MKSATVARRIYYNNGTADFDEALNNTLDALMEDNCIIQTIKYSTVATGSDSTYIMYSALILYDEVPTRTVLTEKADN